MASALNDSVKGQNEMADHVALSGEAGRSAMTKAIRRTEEGRNAMTEALKEEDEEDDASDD